MIVTIRHDAGHEWADAAADEIRVRSLAPRAISTGRNAGQTTIGADGRPVVSFASNDYLGLTRIRR